MTSALASGSLARRLDSQRTLAVLIACALAVGCSKGRSVEGDWDVGFTAGGETIVKTGDASLLSLHGGKAVWKLNLAMRKAQIEYAGTYQASGNELKLDLTMASSTLPANIAEAWKVMDLKGVPKWSGDDAFTLKVTEGEAAKDLNGIELAFTRAKAGP